MPRPLINDKPMTRVNIMLDKDALEKAKVAAVKKGFDPDLAGNTSALLRYLIADFTAKSGK